MKSTLFLLSTAGFIVLVLMTVTGPLLPLIADEFGKSIGTAAVIVTAFVLPYGVCQLVFGPIGDRIGKLRVIALTLGGSTIFTIATGFVETLESLAILRFMTGIMLAATVPLSMAYIADEVAYESRQPVMARYIKGLILGHVAGACCGGLWGEFFDWRTVFTTFGVLSAIVSGVLWIVAGRQSPVQNVLAHRPGQVLAIYAEVFRVRRSRDVIIIAAAEGVVIYSLLAYFGAFLRQEHNLSYLTIGFVLGAYGLGGGIYSFAASPIVRALGERGMVVVGTVSLALCYLLLAVIPIWWACIPVFLVAGFSFYTFHNTMQTIATELSPGARGTVVSFWVFILFVGQAVGVTLYGLVIDLLGFDVALIGASFCVAILGLWFQRRLFS